MIDVIAKNAQFASWINSFGLKLNTLPRTEQASLQANRGQLEK